jgi:hypothetical protein
MERPSLQVVAALRSLTATWLASCLSALVSALGDKSIRRVCFEGSMRSPASSSTSIVRDWKAYEACVEADISAQLKC